MKVKIWIWPGVILISSVLMLWLTFADVQSPLRLPFVLCFALICPGMSFVRLLSFSDRLTTFFLAVLLSIVLEGLISVSMLYLGAWSPRSGLLVLSLLCVSGALLQLRADSLKVQTAIMLKKAGRYRHKRRAA